ncbi:glycosyltransferase [Nocardioides oleivorans]|uniref:Glycosyltransferase n=1 Tax=Nocardioides oleivorans TaxID=273676 RepID=A0A4Q2S1V0_9ACTN|nr:sugar transferase [Nocardioides oleivorans]RYB94299.1 glycosyltransferase [Nocardioides oleivorans]
MRILLVTQWFDPEPTFKGLLFAKELQRLGHEVEVLTGFPNYPGGRVYDGYRIRPFERTEVDGVPVTRVALYPSHDGSGVRRLMNYGTFAVSAALAALVARRPDVAYVYHPPGTIALPAMALRVLRGVPFVYDVHDLWPDTLSSTGMVSSGGALGLVGAGMKWVYRLASEVVVISEGFRGRLRERGVPDEKITVIPTWTYEDDIAGAAAPAPDGGPFTVVFAGTMGKAQALDTVLDAAVLLQSDAVRFVMVGGGIEVERLTSRVRDERITNVTFLPRRPPSEIGEVLASADALLVHLRKDPLFEITVPSKTQAYMVAGKPILMGVSGDATQMVEDAGAGVCFEPEDPAALAHAVRRLAALPSDDLAAMGTRGKDFYQENLSLAVGAGRLVEVLDRGSRSRHRFERTKRVADIVGSGAALSVFALPMGVVAVAVRRKLGTPVIFRQERPGRHGEPFTMVKFRTMTDAVDEDGELLPDSQRLTKFGTFLRLTSLDELPELVNVLRGEMSLVGPRPLLTRYTEFFTESERRRLDVRPGITGLAQVRGRNLASWDERLAMDVEYVEKISPWFDLRVIAETVVGVFRRSGAVADPESIMQNLDDARRSRAGAPS